MANWLNGNIHRLEGIVCIDENISRPIEEIIEDAKKKKLLPKDAVVTAIEQTSKRVRIKYVKLNDSKKISSKKNPKREVIIRASLEEKPVIKKEIAEIKGVITGEEITDKFYRVRYVVL